MSFLDDLEMEGLSIEEKAKRTVKHVLMRIHTDSTIGYHMGVGTQSFSLLTELAASLLGEPVAKIRERFACREAADPVAASLQHKACEVIARSSSADFESALDWGQWCRDLAQGGLEGDRYLIEEAARK